MAKGRFGLPRPLAVENELLNVSLVTDKEIHKSEIETAAGWFLGGEFKEYFNITGVDVVEDYPDHVDYDRSIDVGISVDEGMVDVKDINITFRSNLIDTSGVSISPSNILVAPSIEVNRMLADTDDIPLLVMKMSTSRLDEKEFRSNIEDKLEEYDGFTLRESTTEDGDATVYATTKMRTPLNIIDDIQRNVSPPGNKKTTDLHFDVVAIGHE